MPPIHPLLQRALIALGGAIVSTGVIVKTAKNKHRPAKKRRRKKTDPPVVIGTVAKREAGEEFVPGMTGQELLENIKGSGRAFVGFFRRKPKPVVDDSGALTPDEVKTADGTTVSKKASAKASSKKKPLTAAERRRRRKRRGREATLFESAKESLRQVVKEETNKAVEEKIESAGLKKAADALKQAGDSVKEAAQKVQEQIPDDANEKLQAAGKSFLAGAKKLGATIGQGVQQAVQSLQEQSSSSSSSSSSAALSSTVPAAPDASTSMTAPDASTSTAMTAPDAASTAMTAPDAPTATSTTPTAASLPVEPGLSAEELGQKVQDGVKKVGAFLSGPGNPGYGNRRRGGGAGGDIVDAKDPDPRP